MRKSYVQIDGVLYEKGQEPISEGVMVMPDIQPYTSMITGETIHSRSQHREHLRQHNCFEVGNEAQKIADRAYKNIPDVAPQQRKELIRSQIDAMTNREFKAALKRDADRVKWNSNY